MTKRAAPGCFAAALLLDQTLVVWGGEFGRTPQSEKGDGRDQRLTDVAGHVIEKLFT